MWQIVGLTSFGRSFGLKTFEFGLTTFEFGLLEAKPAKAAALLAGKSCKGEQSQVGRSASTIGA